MQGRLTFCKISQKTGYTLVSIYNVVYPCKEGMKWKKYFIISTNGDFNNTCSWFEELIPKSKASDSNTFPVILNCECYTVQG